MENSKRRSNARGRFLGQYRAKVVNNVHEKGWHMATVRLIGHWDDVKDEELPWAEYLLPLGARLEQGQAMPVQKDDLVWVDFPQSGDTRYPRIVGSAYQVPEGEKHLPLDLFEPTFEHKRADGEPEPPTAQYGDAVTDLYGLLHQLTLNGDYCLTHKATGTAISIDANGNLILHSEVDSFKSSTGNTTEKVGGELNIFVEGTTTIDSKGHATVKAPTVDIGDSALEPAVLGDKFKSFMDTLIDAFNNHNHTGNMGSPTSPPLAPQQWQDCLSKSVKVK